MTTASGALNGFPLNGNFDASIVGIAVPLMDLTVQSEGVSISVGVTLSTELSHTVVSAIDATVGMTFQPLEAEEGVFGLEADGTTVKVDAEDLTPNSALDVFGIFQPTVGISYEASFRPWVNLDPITPTLSIGQEYTFPVLLEESVSGIIPAWFIYAEGQISQTLQINVVDPTIQFTAFFEIEIFESGQVTQTIQQDIINQDIQVVSQTFEQVVFEDGQPSVTLQQEVIDHTLFVYGSGDNECWRAVVTIGGVDVSTDITGVIRVEAEESTARIADFQMKPSAGAIDTTVWINEQVTIDYALFDPVTDLITTQVRVFGGTVDEPIYDPNTRIVSFKCSDNLQQELESMTRAQIDNITPNTRWTPLVFDEEADNYQYAQDRQSTYPAALDKNIGGSYEFTAWAAKVTPDYTFTLSNIVDASLGVELTSRRNIVNRIDLTFGYGYDRLMQREAHVSWHFPGSFCEFLGNGEIGINVGPFTIPNRDMVESAIDSTGWCARDISYTKLPRSTTVFCPGAGLSFWVINQELRNYLIMGFNARIQKRFVKGVQEDFGIVITNADSILLYGQNNVERSASVNADYDTSDWNQDDFCNDPDNGGFMTIPVPQSPGSFDPPCDSYQDTDTLAVDGTDRTSVDFAIETEIARSRVEMLDNHRGNLVSFQTPLFPIVERSHTIEIDTATVDARGKVLKFTHSMDLTSGQAVTDWELAISKAGGTTEVDSPIVAPTPPDTVTPMIGLCEKPRLGLPTQYGGIGEDAGGSGALSLKSVPEPDPDDEEAEQFTGYTGNKDPADPDTPTYAVRMSIPTEEIASGDQDELVAENETPYTVAIPDELLNLFA
jgi:hypothetical protein